jgi:hypothetical protein
MELAPSPFDSSGAQFAWDSTSISLAQTCLQKYKLKMIDGWRPAITSVHLEFGAVYASALEHYFKHIASGMDKEKALETIVLEALVATWDHDRDESFTIQKPVKILSAQSFGIFPTLKTSQLKS